MDDQRPDMGTMFHLAKMDTKLVKHPAAGNRELLYLEGQSPTGKGYSQPIYCELTGALYPIESPQWAYWNTGCPENGMMQCVRISTIWGGKVITYYPSLSGIVAYGSDVVIDRPWWAPGFKL